MAQAVAVYEKASERVWLRSRDEFIAQPTLSQQIRRLEEMMGTPLPVIAGQDLLPGQADFNQAFDPIGVQLYRPVPERLAGVVLGLQKAGYDAGLEDADGGGSGFQADVDLVRVRQNVAEGMPPAGLASLPAQLDQPIPLGQSRRRARAAGTGKH